MREKHLIRLRRAAAVPVHPKPMVEGLWRGWMGTAALTDTNPIINYHGIEMLPLYEVWVDRGKTK